MMKPLPKKWKKCASSLKMAVEDQVLEWGTKDLNQLIYSLDFEYL